MQEFGPVTESIYGKQDVTGFFEKAAASVKPESVKRHASVTGAIMAFEKLERKRHQIERAERELHSALVVMAQQTAGDEAQFQEYVSSTEIIRQQVEATCRECTPSPTRALADSLAEGQRFGYEADDAG